MEASGKIEHAPLEDGDVVNTTSQIRARNELTSVEEELRQMAPREEGPEQQSRMETLIDAAAKLADDLILFIISLFPPIPLFRSQCVSKTFEKEIKSILASKNKDIRFLLPGNTPLHSIAIGNVLSFIHLSNLVKIL